MEEEIITPEEETFDYNKLRYILTNDGYICHAAIGGFIVCDLGECTEYNGDIPDGYETIEEWYEEENERLNAWKIVDGNLEFDPNKYEILQAKCEKEHEDNRPVCHKEISNLTNLVKSDNADNYEKYTTYQSNIIEEYGTNKFASTYIELLANEPIKNKVHIKFNNKNLLTNSATSKMESGISFEVNTDRTIYIDGTATNDIEYDIGGYPNNTKPILAFKKGYDYYLSSNGHQIKMYNFDGTDREEIYSGTGGVISFNDNDKVVTHIVLYIPNETKVNTTIKPMLNLGDYEEEYITYEGNDAVVYLGENIFTQKDIITIDGGETTYKTIQYPSSELQATKGLKPSGDLTPSETLEPSNEVTVTNALYPSNTTYPGYTKVEYLENIIMPNTYLDFTYMYCMEDVDLIVTYPSIQRVVDLTNYETPNGGFAIDEEGNAYLNDFYARDGVFRGGDITLYDENEDGVNNPKLVIDGKRTIIQSFDENDNPTEYYDKYATGEYLSDGIYFDTEDDYGERHLVEYTDDGVLFNHYNGVYPWQHAEYTKDRIALAYFELNNTGNGYLPPVQTVIEPDGITTPILTQTSKAESKKNFKLLEDALKIINDTDIYKYNLINEDDDKKKHIGLVIGEDYKYSSEITSINKDGAEIGVDTYSMVAVCFKAIQEQQKQIEELTKELNKLKESDQSGEN